MYLLHLVYLILFSFFHTCLLGMNFLYLLFLSTNKLYVAHMYMCFWSCSLQLKNTQRFWSHWTGKFSKISVLKHIRIYIWVNFNGLLDTYNIYYRQIYLSNSIMNSTKKKKKYIGFPGNMKKWVHWDSPTEAVNR